MNEIDSLIARAAEVLATRSPVVAFTGAGISVESGIPPFRGPGGLWSRYDPMVLDIGRFYRDPRSSWVTIKEIFYDYFGAAQPNAAHRVLSAWEQRGLLAAIITQNIDGLHQDAGSTTVVEYHGASSHLRCDRCGTRVIAEESHLEVLPPLCPAGHPLRPDFVFFGEPIPAEAQSESWRLMGEAEVVVIVGSTGEIYPASQLPYHAASRGARIIEINPEPSNYTAAITDIHIPLPATEAFEQLEKLFTRSTQRRR